MDCPLHTGGMHGCLLGTARPGRSYLTNQPPGGTNGTPYETRHVKSFISGRLICHWPCQAVRKLFVTTAPTKVVARYGLAGQGHTWRILMLPESCCRALLSPGAWLESPAARKGGPSITSLFLETPGLALADPGGVCHDCALCCAVTRHTATSFTVNLSREHRSMKRPCYHLAAGGGTSRENAEYGAWAWRGTARHGALARRTSTAHQHGN